MTQTNGTDGQTPYRCVMFSAMDTAIVIMRGYEMPFGGQTRMNSRSHALDGGAHWCHLANTLDRSVRGTDRRAVQKRMNGSRCRWGGGLVGTQRTRCSSNSRIAVGGDVARQTGQTDTDRRTDTKPLL